MERWNVDLLGIPRAWSGERCAHLRSEQTWGVLASLLLQPLSERTPWERTPVILSRDLLADRFWPEVTRPRSSLRMALLSLRQNFGDDCLIANSDTLCVTPERFQTDIEQIGQAYQMALASDATNERLKWLSEAEARIRGEFLQDCDDPVNCNDPWITRSRRHLSLWLAEILLEYSRSLEQATNLYGAFDIARRVVQFDPNNQSGWDRVWELGRMTHRENEAERLGALLNFEEALPRIQVRQRQRLTLAPGEERAFERVYLAHLSGLAENQQKSFLALSIFPGPFSAEQAGAVCRVSGRVLGRLVERQLIAQEGDRFLLLDAIRTLATRSLPTATRRLLLRRQARFCCDWLQLHSKQRGTGCPPPFSTSTEAEPHLHQALDWHLQQEPTDYAMTYLHFLLAYGVLDMAQAVPYCERAVHDRKLPGNLRRLGGTLACQILIGREEFDRVSTLCALLLETAELDYSQEDVAHLRRLLGIALFHTEAYQEALVQVRSAREQFEDLHAWSGMAETLRMEGEVQACLGDLNSAISSYRKALELYRTAADSPLGRAECLYQIGINERRHGNNEAAMECWRESLGIRQDLKDVHGVADCIQEIGRVHAERGQLSEARAHVEHALLLYERAGATASRMAALGTLGDLYNRAGRVEEACAVYREALSFWEDRQHSRWTAVFRQRLQHLQKALGLPSTTD